MVIFISLWRWRKTPNFRLCCKATEKLVDSQEKVRTGWGGAENYVQLFDTIEQNGVALEVTPYFLINVSGEGEGFSMWSPTPCDVLATDWVEVDD